MSSTPLHVDVRGTGPAVVLLHGAPTPPEHLAPLAARLAERFRTLLVHLPGYGQSPALLPYELSASHAAVEGALGAHGVREAHLVGYSGGAYRAFALAARGHLQVQRIVALAGFANVEPAERAGFLAYAGVSRSDAPFEPILREVMLSARGKADPEAVADIDRWATATAREHLAQEFLAFADAEDLRPALRRLQPPTLVRVGTADAVCPLERSARVVEALGPAATFQQVEGVGHAILREDLDATARAILAHLG